MLIMIWFHTASSPTLLKLALKLAEMMVTCHYNIEPKLDFSVRLDLKLELNIGG